MITFRDKSYERLFYLLLRNVGKPRGKFVERVVRKMIAFFINTFLTMTCLSGYNETDVLRLLVNYIPSALTVSDTECDVPLYLVVRRFKNLFWAQSHLKKWDSYEFLSEIHKKEGLRLLSLADIVITLMYMTCIGAIKISPEFYCGSVLKGNPFFFREIIVRHWFLMGLNFREHLVFEIEISQQIGWLERRKKQYLNKALLIK